MARIAFLARGAMAAWAAFFLLVPGDGVLGYEGVDVAAVRRLAEGGNPQAQSQLGVLYSSGLGVKLDKKEAASWYAKAARQGYALGEWNLAFMYLRGEGVEENFARARELLESAAGKGLVNAEYDLGMLYLMGVGVPADRPLGEKWLRKAAARGYREAERRLAELSPPEASENTP